MSFITLLFCIVAKQIAYRQLADLLRIKSNQTAQETELKTEIEKDKASFS